MNLSRVCRRLGLGLGLATLLGSATALTACAEPPAEEQGTSAEALTERDWSRAIAYLGSLSYLPWSYTDDGCYARAIYYTMNLAAEGISSNHVYIIAKDGAHGLGSTGRWTYHVAPLVSRDTTNELRVLDPVYASTPLLLRDWYDRQSKYEGTENAPILKVAPGTTYGDRSGTVVPDPENASTASFREPPRFASMPAFAIGNVNAACNIMHTYIDRETTTDAQKETKHHDLSRETRRLVTALADLGKLSGGTALDASCTRFAPELASCPADARATNPGSAACCLASAFWCQSGNTCMAPGTALGDGRVCGLGGSFSHPVSDPSGGSGGSGGACPADSPSTDPGSQSCCLASRHWCWSNSAGVCAAPGTRRTVDNVAYTCGPGGEWAR
ncbi:hypothetical protein BH11MYX4_BH11MYX4_16520 [soil metagenome]